MKNRNWKAKLSVFFLVSVLICSGCGGTKGSDTSAESGKDTAKVTEKEKEPAVKTESTEKNAEENTAVETEPSETQEEVNVLIDTSNERAQIQVIGAEQIQRGEKKYLRVYLERTNLTDQLLDASFKFIAKQDDSQIYPEGRGFDYLKEYAAEEGAEEEQALLEAYDRLVTKGFYLMPGVTKQTITDIKLASDSEVTLQLSSGQLSEEVVWDLNSLPGAPAKLKTAETYADPETWKDAVVTYGDSGTVQVKRTGEIGMELKETALIEDPNAQSPTGKLIQVTSVITNHTDREIKAENVIDDNNILLIFQDGVNMWNVTAIYQKEKTVVAAGESAEVKTLFLPRSDSPVFAVCNGTALSAYLTEKGTPDNFGMVYSLN